jgi:hypothetical protein
LRIKIRWKFNHILWKIKKFTIKMITGVLRD